jgi:hypothetical protein
MAEWIEKTFKRKDCKLAGYTKGNPQSLVTRAITLVEPSRISEQQFRDELRAMTSRQSHCVPQQEVLERVNRYVRGWVNYFHLHNSTRVFCRQRFFLEQRMRKYLQGR